MLHDSTWARCCSASCAARTALGQGNCPLVASAAQRGRATRPFHKQTISPCCAGPVCRPGFGGALCSSCARGSWSAGGKATALRPNCTACLSGYTTLAREATRATACSRERRKCAAGRLGYRMHGAGMAAVPPRACAAGGMAVANITTPSGSAPRRTTRGPAGPALTARPPSPATPE